LFQTQYLPSTIRQLWLELLETPFEHVVMRVPDVHAVTPPVPVPPELVPPELVPPELVPPDAVPPDVAPAFDVEPPDPGSPPVDAPL
jgi:hypothetical protein